MISAAVVAARAGVGYATFFRHYADTEAVLLEIADEMMADVGAAMLPAFLAKDDEAAMRVVTEYVAKNHSISHAMLVVAGPVTQRAMVERAVAQFERWPDKPGNIIPHELSIRFTVAAMISILAWWLEREPGRTPVEVAGILRHFVAEPLSKRYED